MVNSEPGPEILFGLVGNVGVNQQLLVDALTRSLKNVGYESEEVRLIELLHDFTTWRGLPESPFDERLRTHMDMGNDFRTALNM